MIAKKQVSKTPFSTRVARHKGRTTIPQVLADRTAGIVEGSRGFLRERHYSLCSFIQKARTYGDGVWNLPCFKPEDAYSCDQSKRQCLILPQKCTKNCNYAVWIFKFDSR